MIIKLAFRNLTRNRGRLALNVGLVAVTSGLLVFAVGQIGGVKQTLRQSATDTLTGHLEVKPRQAPVEFFQYESSRRLSTISGADLGRLLPALRAIQGVEAVSPRIRFSSLIGDGEQSKPAMIMAVDPQLEAAVCPDLRGMLALMKTKRDAVLAPKLADKLGFKAGAKVVALADTPSGSFNAAEYDLAGLIETPVLIDEFVQQLFLVSLPSAREFLYLEEGSASEVVIRVAPAFRGHLPELRGRVQAVLAQLQLGELQAYTYQEVETSVESIGRIAAGMGTIQTAALIFVMLIATLIITMITLHDRRFEIGMLMSIGMGPNQLTQLFLAEVVMKTTASYLVGAILGIGVLVGIRLAGGYHNAGIMAYIYGGKVMLPVIDLPSVGIGLVLMVGTVALTSLGLCIHASRQNSVTLLAAAK